MQRPSPAGGEAMPKINRRLFIGASIAAAATATTVSIAGAALRDPLLDLIREYQAALDDFNANAPDESAAWDAYAKATFEGPLERLEKWGQPATTHEGAVMALRIATEQERGVYGSLAADSMVMAALGYFEGRAA